MGETQNLDLVSRRKEVGMSVGASGRDIMQAEI